MDTSKEYIKMSWKARKEVGKGWKKFSARQRLGTLICFRSFIGMIINTKPKKIEGLASVIPETYAFRTWCDPENEDLHIIEVRKDFDDEGFPLLRQDQIQEMLPELDNFKKIYGLAEYIERHDGHYLMGQERRSIEQLWLAFYMYEKHKKVWDGEKWRRRK
ncbi:MAG: hypothetical protein KAV87_06300 [Desulfobacteraceae bacterium]|nr:hypothetical protein [Desulfobacteraceae bacterium]